MTEWAALGLEHTSAPWLRKTFRYDLNRSGKRIRHVSGNSAHGVVFTVTFTSHALK